ncbi:MAG: aconitate hydratase [Candidatus Zixiibacteriota bacterium]|nr:MAG: aconitate hydratase [candidate division Zixibacteria bacterium]
MPLNLAQKLISAHLVSGKMIPGTEIAIRVDQTFVQDATGTLALLEFEALGVSRTQAELSVVYVDHNLLQTDYRNADDHLFLQTAAARYGLVFSRPGNGVSHQVHAERFGAPGKSLLGSDSHTPTAGALGLLAIGVGGLDVALAMAGEPFRLVMPRILGVRLTGKLPPWVSGKDVILELLRRHSVKGGVGKIVEYYGPGLVHLTVGDRATIANMGAELGATTTVFPSDAVTRRYLAAQGRDDQWRELAADPGAAYDDTDEVDLSALEPMIALPGSPDRVVPVREAAGRPVHQVIVGSSCNSSLRDLLRVAETLVGRSVHPQVSFEVNPGSQQVLENVAATGGLQSLIRSGARIHQAGCLGCIGMGQAPASGTISLRTFPRNFPGRSGTEGDQVYLCSPETAVASALGGEIADPRELGVCPDPDLPDRELINDRLLVWPPPDGSNIEVRRGPNIAPLPQLGSPEAEMVLEILLKAGDNVSTDDIMPAGNRVLPLRSNIPAIADFAFTRLDPSFPSRARRAANGLVVGGTNYGQGSSREHAALAPRYLGLRAVLVKSFARIHRSNLINFGVLPLVFADPADYDRLEAGLTVTLRDAAGQVSRGNEVLLEVSGLDRPVIARHHLTAREKELFLAGGVINQVRQRQTQP